MNNRKAPVRRQFMTGIWVPIRNFGFMLIATAFVAGSATAQSSPNDAAEPSAQALSGLWVGTVTVDAVDSLARPDADMPALAGGDFSFRLIVHVGETRNARLLKQVVMLTGGGEDMALYTDPAALNAAVERRQSADPESLVETRRVSTPAYDFGPASLPMSGGLAPGQTMRIDIPIRRADPTNPFAHRAHPQHDGKHDGIAPEPDEGGGEIYEIVRRLEFTPDAEPGEDDSVVKGRYAERIEGLSAQPIRVSGEFQLRRVFDNADLDP